MNEYIDNVSACLFMIIILHYLPQRSRVFDDFGANSLIFVGFWGCGIILSKSDFIRRI
jgi:hypothetical protein